jgi:hypothetical protein
MKMKINKYAIFFATVLLTIVLTSCLERREPMLQEYGYVVGKQYFPDTRQLVIGNGISTSGNVIVTTHNVGEEEKYLIMFKCEHGNVFSINRIDLYGKLNEGDSVIINYYEMVNGDGEVKDFDFIDANVK